MQNQEWNQKLWCMLPLTSGFHCHYSYLCRYMSISPVFWELLICVDRRQCPMATASSELHPLFYALQRIVIYTFVVAWLALLQQMQFFDNFFFFHFDHFWWHSHGCSGTNPFIGLITDPPHVRGSGFARLLPGWHLNIYTWIKLHDHLWKTTRPTFSV